jgi:hypothetical protein
MGRLGLGPAGLLPGQGGRHHGRLVRVSRYGRIGFALPHAAIISPQPAEPLNILLIS